MTHIREACAVCVAVLVMAAAYYAADQTGWLWVYGDQFDDWASIAGGLWVTSAALVQLVKGVLS
jgi:hypothetical protein